MRTYAVYRTIALALARIAAWVTNAANIMQTRAERQLRMMRYVYREEEHGQKNADESTGNGHIYTGSGFTRNTTGDTKTTAE